jgi:hypothetical protein
MFRLIAKFDIQLPDGGLLVCRPRTDVLQYTIPVNGFDVELCLNPAFETWRNLLNHDNNALIEDPYWSISTIRISVAREEDIPPPPPQTVDGITSYDERRRYLEERKPAYREVAAQVLNRAVAFFKYRLHNPQLSKLGQYGAGFQNPTWFDDEGEEYKSGGKTLVGHRLPDLASFGVKCLVDGDDVYLQQALQNPVVPELHQELLADAQTAIFEGNLRRGALEMAIACEVAVKQAFFAKSTIAGEAYEYLERKRMVTVSVPELISGAAKQAFGESLKDSYPADYDNIRFLFQCRNKIAHRGEPLYRDNQGEPHEVDVDTLKQWWASVEVLLSWLSEHGQVENTRAA